MGKKVTAKQWDRVAGGEIRRKLREGKGLEAEALLKEYWAKLPYLSALALQTKIKQAKAETRVYG